MAATKVSVTQRDGEEPIPAEVIADSIVEIAKGMKVLNSTRLTREAIVTLVHQQSKVARRDIEIILNNLINLERDWLKPVERKK